jgi:hypothetical protein
METPPNRQMRRLIEKYTPTAKGTRMKLDTTRILKDWQGTALKNTGSAKAERKDKPLALGDFLAGHLAMGSNVPKEKRIRASVLSLRLEQGLVKGEKELPLSDKDVELILEVIDSVPNLPPWLVGAVHYFVAPDKMKPDELEAMAFFDTPPEVADGNESDRHQDAGTAGISDPQS